VSSPTAPSRLDRRKARTRAALIAAARRLLTVRDPAQISIQEITEAADVGFGSFYNHFESKQDLFDVAIEEALDEHGAMLDALTAGISDPAEVFAVSVRITARFPKTHPELARIFVRTGPRYLTAPTGLAPRAMRDLQRAKAAKRVTFDDPAVTIACVGGALLGVMQLSLELGKPARVDRAADQLAHNLLMMLGMPAAEARRVVGRALPPPAGARPERRRSS